MSRATSGRTNTGPAAATTARRPIVRIDPQRQPRPADLDAHQPDRWLPVRSGQDVVLHVGFGLDVDPAVSGPLAALLRPARAVRIAGRTEQACRTARALLVAAWRAAEGGGGA